VKSSRVNAIARLFLTTIAKKFSYWLARELKQTAEAGLEKYSVNLGSLASGLMKLKFGDVRMTRHQTRFKSPE
jgi:hypothetical protein